MNFILFISSFLLFFSLITNMIPSPTLINPLSSPTPHYKIKYWTHAVGLKRNHTHHWILIVCPYIFFFIDHFNDTKHAHSFTLFWASLFDFAKVTHHFPTFPSLPTYPNHVPPMWSLPHPSPPPPSSPPKCCLSTMLPDEQHDFIK